MVDDYNEEKEEEEKKIIEENMNVNIFTYLPIFI